MRLVWSWRFARTSPDGYAHVSGVSARRARYRLRWRCLGWSHLAAPPRTKAARRELRLRAAMQSRDASHETHRTCLACDGPERAGTSRPPDHNPRGCAYAATPTLRLGSL